MSTHNPNPHGESPIAEMYDPKQRRAQLLAKLKLKRKNRQMFRAKKEVRAEFFRQQAKAAGLTDEQYERLMQRSWK